MLQGHRLLSLTPMLFIDWLKFEQFKNYTQGQISLCRGVNCFTGNNGAGKTNVLDAVYYLSFTKSFLHGSDQQHIQQNGADYFFIEAGFNRNGLEETVRIAVQRGRKKTVHLNNNEHNKLSDHIGLYPLVMIAPNDILLIHEGSEERRKFMDGFLSQFDKEYLTDLLSYNRVLEQRNKQLKQFALQGTLDAVLLQTYNEQLMRHGIPIYLKRNQFMELFVPVFRDFYRIISGGNEEVNVVYETDLHEHHLDALLRNSERHDLVTQRTNKGIHKDELLFTIRNQPLKKFGSQGQQKSFIIALKLAQYAYLHQQTGIKPLLLLDDIFEKLDEYRLNTLLQMIAQGDFGQILITDTHLPRLKGVFDKMPQVPVKYFAVDNGNINEI